METHEGLILCYMRSQIVASLDDSISFRKALRRENADLR